MPAPTADPRPLHVLHLTLGADAGGLSRYIIDLAGALRERGYRCSVAGDDGAWMWAFREANVEYLAIPLKGGPLSFWKCARRVRRFINEQRVDLLHTHYRRATLLARTTRRLEDGRRLPLLYTLHLSHLSLGGPRRWVSDFGDHTHVASSDARRWLIDDAGVPESRITLIPHGVDTRRYQPPTAEQRFAARTRLGLSPADRVALFVGRLDYPKNEHWLFDLDDAAQHAGLDLKILLVGEGPHQSEHERRIRAEGRGKRMVIFGHQDPRPFYHAADALLLPSLREGFSLVCAEAMASGVPCLRTRTSGCSELIEEGVTGRSVPIDRDAFVAAAVEFLGDLDALRRMGDAARRRIVEHFTFDRQVERTLELYRRLVASPAEDGSTARPRSLRGNAALGLLGLYSRVAPTQRGGLALVERARRLVPRSQWRSRFHTPDGLRLDLDLATYPDNCMAVGLYELDTTRLLRQLLRPGGHFVDGGANLGYFTVLAARRVGAAGRVDAFEPDPANRRRLLDHVALNRVADRVRVHDAALSDRAGSLRLHHPDPARANHGQSSLFAELAPGGTSFDVPLVRLDEVLDRAPDLLKLDVEGAELMALRGAARLLVGAAPPRLIVEHNPVTSRAAGFAPGDLLRFLHQLDTRWRARWIGASLSPSLSPSQLDDIAREGNLLCDRHG